MLNPWLTFSINAARFGWETQSIMVDQMMRLAGADALDRHEARDASPMASPDGAPAAAAARTAAKAQTSPEARTAAPVHAIKAGKPRKVAQQVSSGHKKQERKSKRRSK
jgi:hypothetical protein